MKRCSLLSGYCTSSLRLVSHEQDASAPRATALLESGEIERRVRSLHSSLQLVRITGSEMGSTGWYSYSTDWSALETKIELKLNL